MLRSDGHILLLLFIIHISAANVPPLKIGYVFRDSQWLDSELNITVHRALKEVKEKILPGISLSFNIVKYTPGELLNTISKDFVALFGPTSCSASLELITNERNIPTITHGIINKVMYKNPSATNLNISPVQFAESILTILQYHHVQLFSIVMETSNDWMKIALDLQPLASLKGMTVESIESFPDVGQSTGSVTIEKAIRKIIDDTHTYTNVYVFLGTILYLNRFKAAMQEKELLNTHFVLAASLEAYCTVEESPQYYDLVPETAQAIEIVVPSILSTTLPSIESENLTLVARPVLNQPTRSVSVFHLYDGIILYARALRLVLRKHFAELNPDIVRLASNASLIADAITSLKKVGGDQDLRKCNSCEKSENSLTVAVIIPDSLSYENNHCHSHSCRVVPIGYFRQSGFLVFRRATKSWNLSSSRWSVGGWLSTIMATICLSLITLVLMIALVLVIRRRMLNGKSNVAIRRFSSGNKSWKSFKKTDLLERVFCLPKVETRISVNNFYDFSLEQHIVRSHHRRLSDILADANVEINQVVRCSLIQDLINALAHLEALGLCHGGLKSSNCFVSPRWQLIVTHSDLPVLSEMGRLTNLLWKAPEQLRDSHTVPTIQGDVYSFSLVVHELIHRRGPFGILENGIDPSPTDIQTILRQIKLGPPLHDKKPFRPRIDQGPDYLEGCWNEYPQKRPNFKNLKYRHNKGVILTKDSVVMRDTRKPSVVGVILDEVNDLVFRAADSDPEISCLAEDVAKAEAQLNRFLPKYVSESLMMNLRVEPKEFPSVAILFGHIMNLEELSANRSPEEIYNFIREVSNGFVSIAGKYRVHKLEALDEDYFVASWPELVADYEGYHAREIALMALELRSHFENFQIPFNSPPSALNLHFSIGIHVGPAVGGVIGLSRPHYHLFGTTVNVSSRLSTSGEPGRIQLSQYCNQILGRYGDFETERRGAVFIKGVGEMSTYWLSRQKTYLQ